MQDCTSITRDQSRGTERVPPSKRIVDTLVSRGCRRQLQAVDLHTKPVWSVGGMSAEVTYLVDTCPIRSQSLAPPLGVQTV